VPPAFNLIDADTGAPAPEAMSDTVLTASSRDHGWDGVVAEAGHSRSFDTDNMAFAGHLVSINIDAVPLRTEVKGPHGHRELIMPPGSCWIYPAGFPFSQRNLGGATWNAAEISTDRVQRLLGHPIDLPPAYGEMDESLAAVVRALAVEARNGSPSGPLFVDGLALAFASALARRAGLVNRRPAAVASLKKVFEKIEDTLAEPMTVDELATIAGLSTAHFAREFKRQTDETPHAFVVRRRLERARLLLLGGNAIADVAIACGFSDQAHLSRLFKRRFGVTPGAITRR
jgi:AraC family transcriptional regulator